MIIPLPEKFTSEEPVIGYVYSVPADIASVRLKYLNTIRFFKIDKQGLITDVSTILNDSTNTTVSFDSIEVGDQLIVVIPIGTTLSKITSRCTVAGSGFTLDFKYWSSTDNTHKPLTVTGGTTYLKSTGLTEFAFTEPTDMGSLPIGRPGLTFYGKPVFIEVASVASPVSPTLQQMYPINIGSSLIDITTAAREAGATATAGFTTAGDRTCLGLDRKFSAFETFIESAQGGGRSYFYYDTAGNEKTLTVTDPTNGWTRINNQTGTPRTFTASAPAASASTVQGLTSYGSIEATANNVPTSSTHRKSIGLSFSKTGAINFELQASSLLGNPRLLVFESGVIKFSDTVDLTATDTYRVERLRHHDNTIKIYYRKNKTVIYTSTVTATSGVLYGRVGAFDTGAIVKSIKMVDFVAQDGVFVNVTLDNVVNGTVTNETAVTEQVIYRRNVTWTPPTDWSVNTAANTPTGASGVGRYHVCSEVTGTGDITPAAISHILVSPVSGAGVTGKIAKGAGTFTQVGLKVADSTALTQALTLDIVNVTAGTSTPVTFATGVAFQEVTVTATSLSDGTPFLVKKTSGQNEVVAGIGAFLSLA